MKDILFRKITRLVGKAIGDFGLIAEGDRVLVALSGGKDSWTLLYALRHLQRKAPIKFTLAAVTVHPGTATFNVMPLKERLSREGIPGWTLQGRIVETVKEHLIEGTNPCSFCARLRRGIIYGFAAEEGWNKIALGHHLDDFIETLLLNLFFNGAIKGMSPHLQSDDGRNEVIRPLVYVKEEMTRSFARHMGFPLLGCSCAYDGMTGSRRHWVKSLVARIEQEVPDVRSNLLASLGRVRLRHLFDSAATQKQYSTVLKSALLPQIGFPPTLPSPARGEGFQIPSFGGRGKGEGELD
jgi:tRNA 2-thiocytidine biosynthesis protein TtcA